MFLRNFIALFCLSVFAIFAEAQPSIEPNWEELTPVTGPISSFAYCDGRMWAVADFLFFSDDEGVSWERYEHEEAESIKDVFCGDFGVVFDRHIKDRHANGPLQALYNYDLFLKSNTNFDFENTTSTVTGFTNGLLKKTDTEVSS